MNNTKNDGIVEALATINGERTVKRKKISVLFILCT